MRSLQHVLWRGAMALGLFLGGGAGVLTLPHSPVASCDASIAQPAPPAVELVRNSRPASSAGVRC